MKKLIEEFGTTLLGTIAGGCLLKVVQIVFLERGAISALVFHFMIR